MSIERPSATVDQAEKKPQEPTIEEFKKKLAELEMKNQQLDAENKDLRRQVEIKEVEKEKYEARFEEAPVGLHVVDTDGYIVEVNQEWLKLMGYEKNEVVGRSIFEFIHPDQVENAKERHGARMKKEEEPIISGPRKYITKDGKTIYVETRNSLIKEGGEVLGNQTMFRDVTVYVEKYQRMQELLKQFRNESTHEIKNPATSAGGFAIRLYKKLPNESAEKEYAQIVVNEIGRMEKVLENLGFVDIFSKEIIFSKGNLNEVLKEEVEKYEREKENKNKTINIDLKASDETYYDKMFMRKVFEEITILFDDFKMNNVRINSDISGDGVVIDISGDVDEMNNFIAMAFNKKLSEGDALVSNKIDGTGGRFALACELIRWQNGKVDFNINNNQIKIKIKLPSNRKIA